MFVPPPAMVFSRVQPSSTCSEPESKGSWQRGLIEVLAGQSPPPLAQLLPCLDELLHGASRGKVSASDATLLIDPLIDVPDGAQAQMRQAVSELLQIFPAQDVFFAEIRALGHD